MSSGTFFRASDQCELLACSVLPALARSPGRRGLKLWSAGCGSGEDAWSLAMLVEEAVLSPRLEVRILATEADPRLRARAGDAVYAEHELGGVDAARRRRHFVRGVGPRQGLWRVIAPLRDRLELAALDLRGAWPGLGGFDVVSCPDAFTGLEPEAAARLVRRLAEVLAPGGVMLLGDAAVVAGDVPELEPLGRAGFRRPGR